MNIVIATDNYPPRYDGISRFLQEIIPALNKEHTVSVIAPDFGPTDDPWPVTKIPVTRLRVGDFHPAGLHFFKVFRAIKDADVVFLQALGSIGAAALIAARMRGKKVVLYTHSVEWELVPRSLGGSFLRRVLPNIIKGIDRLLYKWIDLLIFPSKSVSEAYYWNKIENKRVIINLGVDTKKFSVPKDKIKAKKALGIDEDAFVVGYHGRLAREKDLKTLLRAWLSFRARNPGTKTHLLIVGDGLREIRQLFDREGVTVTGFKEDVVPYLHAMDAYVMSSLTETSCLSVMEAMSCGLAVASTPVGYIPDYITNDKNGMLYPEKNTVLLTKHLESFLDGRVRGRLGRSARKTIEARFSWDKTREQVLSVFERL